MESRTDGGEYRLCGRAVQEVSLPPGGLAEFSEDGAVSGHTQRGKVNVNVYLTKTAASLSHRPSFQFLSTPQM